jgi:hypothetical protein
MKIGPASFGVLATALIAALIALAFSGHTTTRAARPSLFGPEGVPVPSGPVLAPPAAPAPGHSVDRVACGPVEQVAFHIHAHLAVFVDGRARVVPLGIGIAPPLQITRTPQGPYAGGGSCFAYLHTHASDGIIHVESPVERTYTLGDFFGVWKQPLAVDQVGPARGRVTAFVDGRRYGGDPRAIPLRPHARIQLDVGTPVVPPQPVRSTGQL